MEKLIPQNLIPNHKTPDSVRQKVLNHIYGDFSGKTENRSLFTKIRSFRYAIFGLFLLLGFGVFSVLKLNQNNINPTEQIKYATELNQVIKETKPDLTQLISMVDKEDSLQF